MKIKVSPKLCLLALLLFFFSCQKEDVMVTDEPANEVSNTSIQPIPKDYYTSVASMEDIMEDRLFSKAMNALYNEKNAKGAVSKFSESNDFVVDPTSVLKTDYQGKTTFTFQAYPTTTGVEPDLFYNIILEIDENGQEEIFGLTYRLLESLDDGSFTFEGPLNLFNVSREALAGRSYEVYCRTVYVAMCSYGGTNHIRGGNCTPAYHYVEGQRVCQYDIPGYGDPSYGGSRIVGSGTGSTGGGLGAPTGPVNNGPSPYVRDRVLELSRKINLLQTHEEYLIRNNRMDIVSQIEDFLRRKGSSSANKAFAREVVAASWNQSLASSFPLIKYPKSKARDYKKRYPKLSEYLKNQMPKVANIAKIVDAIHEFTQLPKTQIKEELQWGKGPELHTVQLDNYPNCSTCDEDTVGFFDRPNNPDKIFLDIDYINQLENGTLIEQDNDAAIFFIGTTILHEFVHWGENSNVDFTFDGEEGVKFEIRAYGQNVNPENARLILNRQK